FHRRLDSFALRRKCRWRAETYRIRSRRYKHVARDSRVFPQQSDPKRSSSASRFASLHNLLSRTLVDEFLEFLAGFEIRNPLGGNINGGAGLGISASARATLAHTKATEAS